MVLVRVWVDHLGEQPLGVSGVEHYTDRQKPEEEAGAMIGWTRVAESIQMNCHGHSKEC